MGGAAVKVAQDLGATAIAMDVAEITHPGARAIHCDLRDRASIDAALDQVEGPIDALLACSGVADGTSGIERINFIGHRHLIERAVEGGKMPRGSAIAMISSVAGIGWEGQLPTLLEYLDTPDFESAVRWIEEHPGTATYGFSKQAMCAYVARQAYPLLRSGIRINAILPGPTDTPLARANADTWLTFGRDFRDAVGLTASTPEEQAEPLVFLCTQAARHIAGVNLVVDAGYVAAGMTGAWDAPGITALLSRR
jgi:NAD(P)-dependent dehydrogenase (short-subunit alcohol dehydrogenase family)